MDQFDLGILSMIKKKEGIIIPLINVNRRP